LPSCAPCTRSRVWNKDYREVLEHWTSRQGSSRRRPAPHRIGGGTLTHRVVIATPAAPFLPPSRSTVSTLRFFDACRTSPGRGSFTPCSTSRSPAGAAARCSRSPIGLNSLVTSRAAWAGVAVLPGRWRSSDTTVQDGRPSGGGSRGVRGRIVLCLISRPVGRAIGRRFLLAAGLSFTAY